MSSTATFYRPTGGSSYASLVMTPSGGTYSATLPGSAITPPGLEYLLEARDTADNLGQAPFTAPGIPDSVVVGTSVFTDLPLLARSTPVQALHLIQLCAALNEEHTKKEQSHDPYRDPTITPGQTVIKASHQTELRTCVRALAWERARGTGRDTHTQGERPSGGGIDDGAAEGFFTT